MKEQQRRQKMNIPRWALALITTLMLPGLLVTGAYAMTVSAGSGQVQAGTTTTIPIVIDQSPVNMGYFNVTVSMSDPTVAQITWVTFPGWANWLTHNSSVPAGSVNFLSSVFSTSSLMPATNDLTLATLTVEGLKAGTVSIKVDKAALQWSGGSGNANRQDGTLQVTSSTVPPTTIPTTVPPTTVPPTTIPPTTVPPTTVPPTTVPPTTVPPTTVPTTVPTVVPPGLTGSVYLATAPAGASIYVDGAQDSSGFTPMILNLPVGTHQAVMKLTGYKDVVVNFEIQQGMTTMTATRTLVPGTGTMEGGGGTIPPTTVVTTVPTTIPATQGTSIPPTSSVFNILPWDIKFPQIPLWMIPKFNFGFTPI
jgi:hypothetical protein